MYEVFETYYVRDWKDKARAQRDEAIGGLARKGLTVVRGVVKSRVHGLGYEAYGVTLRGYGRADLRVVPGAHGDPIRWRQAVPPKIVAHEEMSE